MIERQPEVVVEEVVVRATATTRVALATADDGQVVGRVVE